MPELPPNLETSDRHNDTVRRMPLPVDRDELKWVHIGRLGREEARDLLARVCEAKTKVDALRGELRNCVETYVLRGVLAMAENDLGEILGVRTPITVGRGVRRRFEGKTLGSMTPGRWHG